MFIVNTTPLPRIIGFTAARRVLFHCRRRIGGSNFAPRVKGKDPQRKFPLPRLLAIRAPAVIENEQRGLRSFEAYSFPEQI